MEHFEKSQDFKENVMKYWIFCDDSCDQEEVQNDCLARLSCETAGFIWQQEPLNLKAVKDGDKEIGIPHLYGCTDYGDNVGDLWFITYLLQKLTKEIDQLVVKVSDCDGEFLLIEAADYLPKWVTPDTSTNRVFIYQGDIHIIPLAKSPSEVTPLAAGTPTVPAAVHCVRTNPTITRANSEIQNAINKRLNGYPALAVRDVHSTTCYLPVPAAQLLHDNPQLISEATRAFYLRDPIDLKCCQVMKHFSPDNRLNTKVKMTRCLYAQLMQQKFYPAKRSAWNLPPPNSDTHKAHDLGMKIAHGFEILCNNAAHEGTDNSSNEFDESGWLKYLSALQKYNYFQGEIEGSIRYKELHRQARQYYQTSQELSAAAETSGTRNKRGQAILSQLKHSQITEDELRQSEKNLTPDDDDAWLYMTYAELDSMLEDYSGLRENSNTTEDSASGFDPSQLTESMSAFINKQSNIITGAELPASGELKFDSKGFLSAIEKMMNGEDEKDLDSDDDSLDEYDSDDSLTEDHSKESLPSKPANGANGANGATGIKQNTPSMGNNKVKKVEPPKNRKVGFEPAPKSKIPSNQQGKGKEPKPQSEEPKIEDFMEMMDRELSKTHIGKSFEKQPKATNTTTKQKPSSTTTSQSSRPQPAASLAEEEGLSDLDDDSDNEPVDMDLNTVKNLLESYSNQMGLPGPTSNLLEGMGLKLPQNTD